jgi:hypothetical protein
MRIGSARPKARLATIPRLPNILGRLKDFLYGILVQYRPVLNSHISLEL